MLTIYAEIHNENSEQGVWRAGVLFVRNGLAACPGTDEYYATREEAEAAALEMMEDYAAEYEEQGEAIERGGLTVVGL